MFGLLLVIWMFNQILLSLGNQDLVEKGKLQYQLLIDRGNLPQYGSCWKSAVEYLEKSCRYLTEYSQSEIALQLTNCFLDMSGHDTFNCHLDKKPNLRAICISTMSDRAFNVYTEFYTQIQNICGFLQGHIWHEMISEKTMAVGRQLQETAHNQEGLLKTQKESLALQEKMLHHGRILENVLDDLFHSFKTHQDVLNILSQTVSNLQNWIIGEMSWIDSLIFYTVSVILIFIFTLSQRTSSARLIIFFLLFINFMLERLICSLYIYLSSNESFTDARSNMSNYIWFSRYGFMIVSTVMLLYFALTRSDPFKKIYEILCSIQKQNSTILNKLNTIYDAHNSSLLNNYDTVNNTPNSKFNKQISNQIKQDYFKVLNESQIDLTEELDSKTEKIVKNARIKHELNRTNGSIHLFNELNNTVERYNLRSSSRCSSIEPKS